MCTKSNKVLDIFEKQSLLYGCRSIQSKKEIHGNRKFGSRNRKRLSGIIASCSSKIKKPNEYCFRNQTKFSIFLRNDCDCMVVDPYKARERYTVTETLFLCMRRKFGFNKKICTKLAFQPQQKN